MMSASSSDIFRSLQIIRKPLYEQVADEIQEMIATNRLKRGALSSD